MMLRSLMEDEYRLVQPEISLIRAGGDGNLTYKIVSNDVPFIARIYGGKTLKNPDWARYELELLIHLAKNGISVAGPIPSFRGRCLDFLLNLGGSPALAALFNFAEGSVE